MNTHFRGNLVDLDSSSIRPVEIVVRDGMIVDIQPLGSESIVESYYLPGFVDAHIHIESSLLTVGEFARAAVVHGTVATVSDPHEIANVLGERGIQFMLDAAEKVPLKVYFGVPSCVPATEFETSGARLDSRAVLRLLSDSRLKYLSEMMNFPGVLAGDAEVHAKLHAAAQLGKPVDGHAPGLTGVQAAAYFAAGISTDHECTTREEALEKLAVGCKIQIRQGSAARNFDALYSLIDEYPDRVMFCSDDKHPDDLLVGHIDVLVRDAIARGQSLFHVLQCACRNPVQHYGLDVGQLRVGDPADFIEVNNLTEFRALRTVIGGQVVAANGEAQFVAESITPINVFHASRKLPSEFAVPATSSRIRIIEAIDGELMTRGVTDQVAVEQGVAVASANRDLLKITVVNRYRDAPPAVGFIRNFGLKRGAIASSVAHDCHNIVAVGTTDASLAEAVNLLIDAGGGMSLVDGDLAMVLRLPIAGLMSAGSCQEVAAEYTRLNLAAASLGTNLRAPFMTLSFMALLVIPALKLSDQGLFDGERFEFVSTFI